MSLTQKEEQRFQQEWDAWFQSRLNGPFFKAKDEDGRWSLAAAMPAIYKFAKLYVEKHNSGFASKSAFSIVLNMMLENGDLLPVKDEEPQIPAEIAEFIRKAEKGQISTFELRRRYMSDKQFRDAYDIHSGLASFASQPVTLTVQQFRSMPSAVVQKRYRQEPAFKAAVDALLASGRV